MSSDRPDPAAPLRLSEIPRRKPTRLSFRPEGDALAGLRTRLDLLGLSKVAFAGELVPRGKTDWDFTGTLGATVVQPCVATLAPVTTRIDERIERRYRAEDPLAEATGEVEMPEDDALEPLPEVFDPMAVLEEALALALPPWPRAPGAAPARTSATPPGADELDDAAVRPFAGLAALRDKLAPPED